MIVKVLGKLVLGLAVLTFMGSGVYLAYDYLSSRQEQSYLDSLTKVVEQHITESPQATDEIPQVATSNITIKPVEKENNQQHSEAVTQNRDAVAQLVQDFLTESTAFGNQAIGQIRLEIVYEPGETVALQEARQIPSSENGGEAVPPTQGQHGPTPLPASADSGLATPIQAKISLPVGQATAPQDEANLLQAQLPVNQQEANGTQNPSHLPQAQFDQTTGQSTPLPQVNASPEGQSSSPQRVVNAAAVPLNRAQETAQAGSPEAVEQQPSQGETPRIRVRVLIDGQAAFSVSQQNQVDQLASAIQTYIEETPDWTPSGKEVMDFEVNIEAPPPLPQYEELYAQNQDMVGWIKLEGTQINYPVMQTRDDPEFYLSNNFEKTYARSGLPFLDARCDLSNANVNLLVHGHNMKGGSMFSRLLKFENKRFWQDHKIIQFDLVTETREYEVMAMFRSKQYEKGEEGFRFYDYIDLSEWGAFNAFVTQVKGASLFDTGITAQWGDELLTLSTCSYHTDNGRFVIVGRRIK